MNAREMMFFLDKFPPDTPVVLSSGYFPGYDDVEIDLEYISLDNAPDYRFSRGGGEVPSLYKRDRTESGRLALILAPVFYEADMEVDEYLRWLSSGRKSVPNWRDG